jgi:hypothetical protein
MEPTLASEGFHCACSGGNCLTLECQCFLRGRMCNPAICPCPDCKNNEEHTAERLTAIERILLQNSMAFTAEGTLTQEECASICNFAILTTSVNSEPFRVKPRETALSRILIPPVIKQAVKTIMSAANEELKVPTTGDFEERTENSVAGEFENVLSTLMSHIRQ